MGIISDRSNIRLGEKHQRAKFTDAEVEIMRQLHEDGMTYDQIAEKFDANKYHIGKICRYERRTFGMGRFIDRREKRWQQISLF